MCNRVIHKPTFLQSYSIIFHNGSLCYHSAWLSISTHSQSKELESKYFGRSSLKQFRRLFQCAKMRSYWYKYCEEQTIQKDGTFILKRTPPHRTRLQNWAHVSCFIFCGLVEANFTHILRGYFSGAEIIVFSKCLHRLWYRVTSRALGQWYDCPSANATTLRDMGKYPASIHFEWI